MWQVLRDMVAQPPPPAVPAAADAAAGTAPDPQPAAKAPQPAAKARGTGPRRLRGVMESADAVRAARLLRGTLTHERAGDLLLLLHPYRRRVLLPAASDPRQGLAGQAPARLYDMVMRQSAPVLLDVFMPACRDHVIDRLASVGAVEVPPDDASLASVMDVVDAMRTIARCLRGAGRPHLLAVANAVELESRTLVANALRDVEANPSPTHYVTVLSQALMRLEALRLVLESIGAKPSVLNGVAYESRRVARRALRHAAETINAYVDNRDLIRLRNSLTVLAAIDNLLVLALRILDALQDREEEPTPFVKVSDEAVLDDYMDAATRLAQALVVLVRETVTSVDFDTLLFAALVRKIKWLHRFCTRLGHARRPPALDELADFLVLQSALLARRVGDALADSLLRHPPDRAQAAVLVERAAEIADLLPDMNRAHVRDALLVRLQAARETLESTLARVPSPRTARGEGGAVTGPGSQP